MALAAWISIFFAALVAIAPCGAFSPNRLTTTTRSGLTPGRDGRDSEDHTSITRDAALQVARSLLLDNPNGRESHDSTAVINRLPAPLSSFSLFAAYYQGVETCDRSMTSRCTTARAQYSSAVEVIARANADTAAEEGAQAETIFASEQFHAGQARLLRLRRSAVESIRSGDQAAAHEATGRLLHTLQSFYSRSNWVELGNTEPYGALGREGAQLDRVLAPDAPACTDCTRGNSFGVSGDEFAQFEYTCVDNIRSDVLSSDALTSGYLSGALALGANGGPIPRPAGKCAHGGIGDVFSDSSPTGGINKELTINTWSPHHYHHVQAADLAIRASVDLLQDIRAEVGDDDAFADFLNIELETDIQTENATVEVAASIAYVIDTTGSMSEELPEIQSSLDNIRRALEEFVAAAGGNAAVDLILVPFNDPDGGIIHITEDIDAIIDLIDALTATGGGDCPEPSTSATIRAAEHSQQGASIFIYTDAPPSDPQRIPELVALAQQKSLRLNYILTDGCSRRRRRDTQWRERRQDVNVDPYGYLAMVSGGQVFNVNAGDISELYPIITDSIQLSSLTIFHRAGNAGFSGVFNVSVDSTITELVVRISADSLSSISLSTPQGLDATVFTEVDVTVSSSSVYLATVNVVNASFLGTWQLSLTATGSFEVLITANTELAFSHRLYRLDSSSPIGLRPVENSPLEGETLILAVEIDEEINAASLSTVQLLSTSGASLTSLELVSAGEGVYFAELQLPGESFRVQVLGEDSGGYPLSRISSEDVETANVKLMLGVGASRYPTLMSGENQTISLLLSNLGEAANFELNITTNPDPSPFNLSLTVNGTVVSSINLAAGASSELELSISAPDNATDGASALLTVTAAASTTRSNFVTVRASVTTIPPVDTADIEFFTPPAVVPPTNTVPTNAPTSSATGLAAVTGVILAAMTVTASAL